jgi:hypothetical protein
MGGTMGDAVQDKRSGTIASVVAVFSLVVAVVALGLSLYNSWWSYLRIGELVVHEPTGFCIVRGYTELGFESDHLVIPIVIENTGKGAKIFEQPTLSLTEKVKQHEPVVFTPAGTLPDLYRTSLDKNYEIGFGWHVPENSVARYFVVFHIQNWWDDTKPEYSKFQFKSKEEWNASLVYIDRNGAPQRWHNGNNDIFFTMPVYPTIDALTLGGSYNSDCFTLRSALPALESSR